MDKAPSIIGADMRITGDLHTDGDVQVDGTIDGDIHARSLTVGRSAEINGEVIGQMVQVYGTINGRISGQEVTRMDSARIHGDIMHDTLEIARGAAIEGMVKRHPAGEEPPAKPKALAGPAPSEDGDTPAA